MAWYVIFGALWRTTRKRLRTGPIGRLFHDDLTARHVWLIEWKNKNFKKLAEDSDYYDVKVAGWWVWGMSNWIGGGWCIDQNPSKKIPHSSGVQGVQAQQKLPKKRPRIGVTGYHAGINQGVQANFAGGIDPFNCGERLIEWFQNLAQRLSKVTVFNRDWKSLTSPSVLGNTTTVSCDVAVFLDPPYITDQRSKKIYQSDLDATSDDVAKDCYQWAVDHGDRFKIAYCAHVGDFDLPAGWIEVTAELAGIRNSERKAERRDCIMFSPACARTGADRQQMMNF